MGVDAVPHCFSGVFCDIINWGAKKLVYMSIAQNWIVPAGYFRDINNFEVYQRDSVFLPAMNNEEATSGENAALRKKRFSSINGGMFMMFSQDTMIYPKETAWFQSVDTHNHVVPLNGTDFYNKDFIGLKNLTEAGKIQYK